MQSANDIKDDSYYIREIAKVQFTPNTTGGINKWVDNASASLEANIRNIFEEQRSEPTENNPESSRSHVLVCMQLVRKNAMHGSQIILADLAGVENVMGKKNKKEEPEEKPFPEDYEG
jgi:hypothetical protein